MCVPVWSCLGFTCQARFVFPLIECYLPRRQTPDGTSWGIVSKSNYSIRKEKKVAKIKFNGLVSEVSGGVGGLVVRRSRGKFILSDKPTVSEAEPSEAQLDQRKLFARAVAFGKFAIEDPALRAFYEPIAQQREITAYALAIGDYLKAPSILPLDLSAYRGQVGDSIGIEAVDDLGLAGVSVSLVANDGTPIEQGNAVEIGARSGYWTYTATAAVALGSDIFIEVQGTDHAGNRTQHTESPRVGEDS
jgi:hypothetical protein